MKLGQGFPEMITFERKARHFLPKENPLEEAPPSFRVLLFVLFLIAGFFLLGGRCFDLIIVKGGYYRQLSEGQRVREVKIPAPRGIIYDRNGVALVRNVPSKNASLAREYIYKEAAAHLLGYLGEAAIDEVKGEIKMGDWLGKTGVEEAYDDILRGTPGKELIETDVQGQPLRTLGQIPPRPGENLRLSLNLSLQKIAASELKDKKGAVVVSNPETGEILVLYSSPSFDPNIFSEQNASSLEIEKLLSNPEHPLFNRAIAGVYPPGSTFKIIVAAAGLEEGKITKETEIEDTGVIYLGPYKFPNWYFQGYGKTEGFLNIVGAIKRSNDIFFYKTGEMLGWEKIGEWAKKFGLGRTLGIDISGEGQGLIPDDSWKRKNTGEGWYLGDTYHLGIGQGYLLTTPLQVNFWTNVVANGGRLCRPQVLKSQISRLAVGQANIKNQNCRDLGLKKETLSLIKEGMREACSAGGTGWPFFDFKIPVACKTGTAEFGDPAGRTHAWFTVFSPVESPEISVTVLVEEGGEGSNVAAPIAKKILEEWFR